MSTVVLISPGCTDFDEQSRILGSLDLPLNEHGEEQLQEIVRQVSETSVDIILTAPCEPTRSTAEAIASELGIPLKETEGLRNLDQGLWQGLPVDEVRRKYPKVFKQWRESPETICPPEGETVSSAMERIRKALAKPLKRKKTVAIVASEPLTTLISCAIRGCKPEFDNLVSGSTSDQLIEIIETNGRVLSIEPDEQQSKQAVAGSQASA